uniref:Decaprenyl-phosphate phosphoribosyltransferase n=1 Tax=Desulfomonile tiedjei TaxID=2358 RepID=A0A7C4EWW6_9BACT
MKHLRPYLKLLRPSQWIKNGFVLMPLIFSGDLFMPDAVMKAFGMFIAFCVAASATYIINDYMDIEQDRIHPKKKNRPLASGAIAPRNALVIAGLLIGGLFATVFWLNIPSIAIMALAAYLVLQLAYSIYLKHIVIIDVFALSTGFLFRVAGGAAVINVSVSSWLLLCTFSVAIFLALGKRRHEVVFLPEDAVNHRPVLESYSVLFLDQLLQVVTTSTLIFYCLYCVRSTPDMGTSPEKLMLTIPFVTYGIFRYMYLIYHKEDGGSPTSMLLTDAPLLVCTILWLIAFIVILYL